MKVLLQYKSSSKVREIAERTEIYAVIEKAYGIQRENFFLQKYDEEFQEYVDLEDASLIEDKSKIKIIDSAIASETFVNNEHITENNAGPSACNYYYVENDPHVEIILNLKEQWPSVINLPFKDFSQPLADALEKQLDLNWSCSSELVSHLATYAYKYKCYPTKEERLQICEALICKYPYLKNDIGSGTGGWEAKLLNKLKKIRLNDTSLEIRLNRMKRKSSSSVPKKLKLNPEKGEVNWSPDHIKGETEIFQNVHKDIMKEESKKAVQFQDKSKLKSLMELTYSFRRYQINNSVPIAELIREYPIFFQEEEQFEEFWRLTAVNLKETFFQEALSKGPKLFQLFRKNKSDHFKEIKKDVESMANSLDESTTYDQETRFGFFVLPSLKGTN